MRRSLLALSLVFVMTALPAYAHAPRPGPNGGLKVDAGANHHVELVATGTTEVTVYLFDAADQPVSAAGHTGNAILLIDGAIRRFTLSAAEDNSLKGTSPVPVNPGVKGAIQVITPGRMRGMITAFYVAAMNVLGNGLGPLTVALLTDRVFANEAMLGTSMALSAAVLGPAGVLLCWIALKSYGSAVAAARAREA